MPSIYILSRADSFRIYGPAITRRVFGAGRDYLFLGLRVPQRVQNYRDDQQAESARFAAEVQRAITRHDR